MVEAEARRLAEALIAMHLDTGVWSFGFDNAKRRAGLCNFGVSRISVSKYFVRVSNANEVAQIVLHEIAHALAGPKIGHGQKWQMIAKKIGYTGGRTISFNFSAGLAPWLGHCPRGHEHERYKTPQKAASCGKCSRTFSREHLIVWQRRDAA